MIRNARGQSVVSSRRSGWQHLDLHNHTSASYDSSNTLADYERAYEHDRFDVLAVTDHNVIDSAWDFAERASFSVIVGEEIDTKDGELIGLFLTEPLPWNVSAVETAEAIRAQGGLVYMQHPFYRFIRRRLSAEAIAELADRQLVDIIEGLNGGPLMRWTDCTARDWAGRHQVVCGAGSDAHHRADIGTCVVEVPPGSLERGKPLTPRSLLAALEHGLLVDQSRRSVGALAARARYAVRQRTIRVLKREPRKVRTPSELRGRARAEHPPPSPSETG